MKYIKEYTLLILVYTSTYITTKVDPIQTEPEEAIDEENNPEYLKPEECPIEDKVFTIKKRNIFWRETKAQKQRKRHILNKHKPHKRPVNVTKPAESPKQRLYVCDTQCKEICNSNFQSESEYSKCYVELCNCTIQQKDSTASKEIGVNADRKKGARSLGESLLVSLAFLTLLGSLFLIVVIVYVKSNKKYAFGFENQYIELKVNEELLEKSPTIRENSAWSTANEETEDYHYFEDRPDRLEIDADL